MSEASQIAAIIGGGVIGGGWAARFLLAGWDVKLFDPDPDAPRKVGEVLDNARRSLPALYDTKLPSEGQLTFVSSIKEAVSDAVWIQESVPERLDIKHAIFKDIQAHCAPHALIGSSTSGFKPSELNAESDDIASIFVAHPFNPVYLVPVVELVGDPEICKRASDILNQILMKPIIVQKEIDAHVADRLLEAVWREALWLVKDDIATTKEIDDIIRFGFGLRWAQMGLFETYRIAGGEEGMAHFIEQFGPCLKWPWTKLMDVPELTDELVEKIADQSDAQSGEHSIRELEQIRDDNLVSMMRALKTQNWGAGALLNSADKTLKSLSNIDAPEPLVSVHRIVPVDWTDYNGHMNEGRYGQVFSDAADHIIELIGADEDYIESGLSYFTAETNTKFLQECHAGDEIHVHTSVLLAEGKKLKLLHEMMAADGETLATCTQFLLHVDLNTRKSCAPEDHILENLAKLKAAHSSPDESGKA
jgi:carnitine 3-dehydrogenase